MAETSEMCEIPVSLGSSSEDFSLEGTLDTASHRITVSVDNLRRLVRASALYGATTVMLDMGELTVEPHTIALPEEVYTPTKEGQLYTFADGRIVFDVIRRTIRTDNKNTSKLNPMQTRILTLLWNHIDAPLTRDFIYKSVAAPNTPCSAQALNSHISRIRKSFGTADLRDVRLGALRSIDRLSYVSKYRPVCDYALVSRL